MKKKIFLMSLALIILLCGACTDAGIGPSPTETIDDLYPSFPPLDLLNFISSSDTIVLGSVEKTLPAEYRADDDMAYTPAEIKVIKSLKGDYKPGDIFKIYQMGGIVGGVDYHPHQMFFHEDGETYLFFTVKAYGGIIYSEHFINGEISDGYFFGGKTVDEAISITSDCIKTGKIKIDRNKIKSLSFEQKTGESNVIFAVDNSTLKAELLSEYGQVRKTEKWDKDKWGALVSDLDKCGLFDWEKYYGDSSDTGAPYWRLDMETDMGYVSYGGTNAYPDGWDSFTKVIDKYFGTLK